MLLFIALLSTSAVASSSHVSVLAGAHLSDASGLSPLIAATFDVSTPLDGADDFYRLEFRVAASGVAARTGASLDALISARIALAYASVGLSSALRPVPGPLRTDLSFGAGPSVGVRLIDREQLQLNVALHWLPLGSTFDPRRSVAEFWGGWRVIGFQLTGSPFTFESTTSARAFFSAALAVRFET